MDNTKESVISLCSGYAGIERGLELAGFEHRTVAYVEIEAFAIANLVAKMETDQMVPAHMWTNLKTFPAEKFRGRVDGITGGYPCQPFSCAGQRKGTDDPRHLWPHIRRIYQTIQPRWLFLENVEGHISLGLSSVLSDLAEDGYTATWGIFSAEEVGAPHRRKRVFILGNARQFSAREKVGRISTRTTMCSEGIRTIEGNRPSDAGEVVGDAEHNGLHGAEISGSITEAIPDDKKGKDTASEPPGTDTAGELADTNQPKSQGRNGGIMPERAVKWPARPGSPQFDWEEPRVTQPGLGGEPSRSSSRVDRLRLLGNGVVPQTSAKAWITLNARLFGGLK